MRDRGTEGGGPRSAAASLAFLVVCGASALPSAAGAQDTVRIGPDDPGRWGDTLEAVEELRIGFLNGAEHETFGLITDLAVTEDGTIWVADYQVPVIRRYDPAGRYLGSVGREGEGPGEYRGPVGLESLSDGTLALWDYGNRRISVFDSEGTFREGYRVVTGTLTSRRMFYTDTASHFYIRTSLPSSSAQSRYGLIHLSPEGTVVDTVRLPDGGGSGGPIAFGRETLSTWSPYRELVVGHNSEYSFTIRRAEGTSVTVVRSTEPIPVEGEEREWWLARYGQLRKKVGETGRDSRAPIPDTKPAFKNLAVDEEGRIWVHRHVEAERFEAPGGGEGDAPETAWRERPTFDVYGRDGDFLGTIVLPHRTRRIVSRGRTVWGVRRGEYDESYVVRLHLEARRDLAGGDGES